MDTLEKDTTVINTANVGALAIHPGATAINVIQQNFTGFAPEMLRTPIETILELFRQGNKEVAKGQLEILRVMGSQDPRVLPSLDVVSIYLNLLDAGQIEKTRGQLTIFLAQQPYNQTPDLLYDLCTAALLRLEIRVGELESARMLWNSFTFFGFHTKETYYAFIANVEDLEGLMASQSQSLTPIELYGVIEGAIRLNLYELAEKSLIHLCTLDIGQQPKILKFFVEAGIIQAQIGNRLFWSVNATTHDKLISLADESAKLLMIDPLPDERLPLFAATLLFYIQGESEILKKACWSKIGLIEQVHANCCALLRLQYENDPSGLSEMGKKIHRAENDGVFRQQCVDELCISSTVSRDECVFLARYASPSLIQKWLNDGGSIHEEDALSRELLDIYLQCCSKDTGEDRHKLEGREIKNTCHAFAGRYPNQLVNLNPEFVLNLAVKLTRLYLPHEACTFIRPLLPSGDFWLTPLLRCYLDALLRAEKYAEAEKILCESPDRFWDGMIWQVKARLEFYAGRYENAKNAMEHAFSLDTNTQIAVGLFEVLTKSGEHAEIPRVLTKIPDANLTKEDPYSHRVIGEMFKHGFHERAERIVLDWFVEDPQLSAVSVSEILNGLITQQINFGNTAKDTTMMGVSYHDGKTNLTKLIVPPEKSKGQHLLSSTSPLGRRLLEVAPKECFKEGIINYQLEERLPAIVAAYRISLCIRDSMNQGDDPFHMFNVPDDPELFIAQMQDIMTSGRERTQKIIKHDFLPIMIKGQMLKKENPLISALALLSDPETTKHLSPDYDSNSEPESLIIDVYAIAYLAITGLMPGFLALNTRLCISVETENCVRQWLEERQRDKGGMLSTLPNGRPFLLTDEEIRLRTSYVADGISNLISKVEIIHPQLSDINEELINFRDLVDSSVYSSLRLATTCNIPWLCIDFNMAKMIDGFGFPVVKNFLYLMIKASDFTPFSDRKYGLIRNAYERLSFPVRYKDLQDLSRETDESSIEILSRLLRLYPNAFRDVKDAAPAITNLLLPVLADAWLKDKFRNIKNINDIKFPNGLRKLAYSCFYVATQSGGEQKAEYKFSILFHVMAMRLGTHLSTNQSQQMVNILSSLATNFLFGHFMSVVAVNKNLNELLKMEEN